MVNHHPIVNCLPLPLLNVSSSLLSLSFSFQTGSSFSQAKRKSLLKPMFPSSTLPNPPTGRNHLFSRSWCLHFPATPQLTASGFLSYHSIQNCLAQGLGPNLMGLLRLSSTWISQEHAMLLPTCPPHPRFWGTLCFPCLSAAHSLLSLLANPLL